MPRSTPTLHAYLAPIFNATIAPGSIAVAVSGGGDSMALTLLANAWADAHGVSLTALTVDHGLRAESAAEAQQVHAWLRARNIAHHTLTPAPLPHIPNLQTRAREMRYGALTDWCKQYHVATLLIAHHADDQAETVALQQHRGESPPSRSGMALVSMRGPIRVVRPLLGVRKTMLLDYLTAQSQPCIDDPSNRSDAFARNRLRHTMDDATMQTLWQQAQQHGEQRHRDDAARNAWVQPHAHPITHGIALNRAAWQSLPAALRTDLLSRTIQAVGGKRFRPRSHETNRLDTQLRSTQTGKATLGHCVIVWNQAEDTLHITREARRATPLDSSVDAPHISPHNTLKQLASEPFWWFNYPPL